MRIRHSRISSSVKHSVASNVQNMAVFCGSQFQFQQDLRDSDCGDCRRHELEFEVGVCWGFGVVALGCFCS